MQNNTPELSIVLPAYKEKDNLAVLIPQVQEEFKGTSFEVIVVDDNSKDGTAELMAGLNARYQNIIFIERSGLLGLGGALREGYNKAEGQYILSSDSDMSFTPSDMRALFEKIRSGFDMVLGYYDTYKPTETEKLEKRTARGRITFLISKTCNAIIRTLSGIPLKNYNTNFRVIKRDVWKSFRTTEDRQFFL